MEDIAKVVVQSPPVLLLCLGLVLVLLAILGRSPLPSLPFELGGVQRAVIGVIGVGLAGTGFMMLLPKPPHFAISGKVLDVAGAAPLADAIVEAHEGANTDKPTNVARTDDRGEFYLNYGKDDEGRYVRLKAYKDSFAPSTRYALVTSRGGVLTFSLKKTDHAGASPSPVARGPQPEASLDFAPLRGRQLVVWLSTDSDNYSSRIASAFARDFPSAKLVEREVSPQSFVAAVQARASAAPAPDAAFIDNYMQLKPLLDARIVWQVWGTPRFDTRGWWVIFKDTRQVAEAQAFTRWLTRAPGWEPRARNIAIPPVAIQTVQEISLAAVRHIVAGNQADLEGLLDREAARPRLGRPDPSATLKDAQPILTFGNSRIAFVLLAVIASGDHFYGMPHMVFTLRNEGSRWRILHVFTDARMPDAEGAQGIDANPPLLRRFDDRIVSDRPEPPPPPAVLVDPPDGAVVPRFPEPPEITWRSEAPARATFIVESQFGQRGGDPRWAESNLTFADVPAGPQPFRQRAPFGVGAQPHRWRIWTLGESGAVSLSPWRTVIYSN